MTSYVLVDQTLITVYVGGHDDCLSLAVRHCNENPSEELYLLRFRGGEPQGRFVYRIDCSGYKQEFPPKFIHKARISKQGKPTGARND